MGTNLNTLAIPTLLEQLITEQKETNRLLLAIANGTPALRPTDA